MRSFLNHRAARPENDATGPFRAHHIPEGSDYEVSNGHAIRCMSSGERHGAANARGAAVLETDPYVDGAGVDVGVEFNDGKNLRAPDIVIGTSEERPGWSHKIPPLVVEFADVGQDERDLQARIAAVRVTGAVDGSPPSVVVDRLPPEGAAEAAAVICRQASSLLRRPLSGETLRVMRDQDQRPISQAGQVHCL